MWPSCFGPDFDLLYFFTSLFRKCRCLKKEGRLFPLESGQNTYYSVHRSAFYRLLAWSWAEDRDNIVCTRMTWSNLNGGISSFLGQRCELASGQKLQHSSRLVYNCVQIWALESQSLTHTPMPRCVLSWLQCAQPNSITCGHNLAAQRKPYSALYHSGTFFFLLHVTAETCLHQATLRLTTARQDKHGPFLWPTLWVLTPAAEGEGGLAFWPGVFQQESISIIKKLVKTA